MARRKQGTTILRDPYRLPEVPGVGERLEKAFELAELVIDSRMGYGDACVVAPYWEWAADQFSVWIRMHLGQRSYERVEVEGESVVFVDGMSYVIFRPVLRPGDYAQYSVVITLDMDMEGASNG